jgi:hypothetical protein
MAVTNAISAIIIVGAMLAAGLTEGTSAASPARWPWRWPRSTCSAASWSPSACWRCSRRKSPRPSRENEHEHEPGDAAVPDRIVCFIQALKGLSHPATRAAATASACRHGIAVLTTLALIVKLGGGSSGDIGYLLVAGGVVVGGGIGAYLARSVEMTKMPELVAAMHSLIGLAAVCIAVAAVAEPWALGIAAHGQRSRWATAGAVHRRLRRRHHLLGSVIAFGKLSGKYKFRLFQGAPVSSPASTC